MAPGTTWQDGPEFGKRAIDEWPISQSYHTGMLPERHEISLNMVATREEPCIINIERFSKYLRVIYTTARILALKNMVKPSLFCITKAVTKDRFDEASKFWMKECQKELKTELNMALQGKGKFRKLTPILGDDGIFIVGGRAIRWNEMSYNKQLIPILPYNYAFCKLFARHIHEKGHLGVDSDVAKIRSFVWIIGITKMCKEIRNKCVICTVAHICHA